MRIGLDCSSAASRGGTGIAHYIRRLLQEFAAAPPGEKYVACWRLSRHRYRYGITANVPRHIRRAIWQAPLRPVGAGRLDVFHGLDVRVPRWRGPRLVATVHDLFSLITDEFATPKFRKKKIAQYRRVVEHADAIICVSNTTAADLQMYLDAPPDKVAVIYHGVDEAFRPEAAAEIDRVREWFPIPELYLLFVGRLDQRKNVARLVEAFERAAPDLPPDLHLLLVGGGGYGTEAVWERIERSPLRPRILHIPHLEPFQLPPVYASASGLAFTTLYEGFGMPIVEAMASGCPVLTANVGAAPEVGGEAVLTVDPTDVDAIAHSLCRMMTDEQWRIRAIRTGLDRAQGFTWARTAGATRRVYHRLLAGEPFAMSHPPAVGSA